ncbi:hypothetical protein BFW38_16850 [Terasakiispira papahanaumokuakeensis]|uniref:NAD-dependent epimerase/dehydratase domain-containing protein n=1 Tax=Terasakiispira papahanaumokuakeensis TaxID=197479 RepID=A0A1E2VDB2_9GAMM|nr:SDR family oxidoreductase [Terasakiispira papahanaumokuakeensis]ODC04954.1 hypothetical protein BFW38_16850 [Terasakiispira papahanaumokuakeensis]
MKVLIVGCGDLGSAIGLALVAQGHQVWGARRQPDRLPEALHPLLWDLSEEAPTLPAVDYLIYSVAADAFSEEAYEHAYVHGPKQVLAALAAQDIRPQHGFFVSSSSVYGQVEGEDVDETTPTQPEGFAGRLMLAGESVWADADFPVTSLRLTGLYGPGRERLINQVRNGRIAPENPVQYTNRIHRDDAAGVVAHLLALNIEGQSLDACYLVSDQDSAPLHEVMRWLARQLKVTPSQAVDTPLRRRGSKRCSSERLQHTGYRFLYPTFKEGYAALLGLTLDAKGEAKPSKA